VSVAARTTHKSGREYEDLVAVTGQLADSTVTSHLVSGLSPMKERTTVVTGDLGEEWRATRLDSGRLHSSGTSVITLRRHPLWRPRRL
jgi:UDP-N-acetylglucosamine 3-dehydrogenase